MTTAVRHVYVHAPFCRRRCVYCDFAVHVSASPDGDAWLGAIEMENALLREGGIGVAAPLETLYVGGGTPSVLPPSVLRRLARIWDVGPDGNSQLEWTAEANPESFCDEVARAWATAGVNRISFGAQTFSKEALRWMGRLHTPDDVDDAVGRARDHGVSNLSVDLILGLPNSVDRSWDEDLDRVLALDVPHVSVYGLTVEPGTHLHHQVSQGRTPPPSDERYREEYLRAREGLAGAGYLHYEVSNFARPGYESRHNTAYWTRVPYVGLGNGAHSFVDGRRWWNHRSWPDYLASVGVGRLPRAGEEEPTDEQAVLEDLWLSLRTSRGLVLPADGGARALMRVWVNRGLADLEDGRVRLTGEGWLLLDDLVVELHEVVERGRDAGAGALTGGRTGRF